MVDKVALITGITGQDGSYLAQLLLEKGYQVHGIRRFSSVDDRNQLDKLQRVLGEHAGKIHFHYSDLTDSLALMNIIREISPNEIYHLAAQSHVRYSFDSPEYTANTTGLGTLRILESIKLLSLTKKTRFYQASSSELFGKVQSVPQNEQTPFYPRSPYGVAKLYAHWITINYREAYDMYACNGILFNHESPVRGEMFVSRKIVEGAVELAISSNAKALSLGNLEAKRDWGHAKDYVYAMYLMLQQKQARDYVIATGQTYSVKEFCERVFACLDIQLDWRGTGLESKAYDKTTNQLLIEINPEYYRPAEVDLLIGDAEKARNELHWKPQFDLDSLIKNMVQDSLHRKQTFVST